MPKNHICFGWSYKQASNFIDKIQNLGERLNIRILIVWDPEGTERDELYRNMVRTLIELISKEQNLDFSDVTVIMLKEMTQKQQNELTSDDIKEFLNRA